MNRLVVAALGLVTLTALAHTPEPLDIVRPTAHIVRVDQARALVERVNAERVARGLGALMVDVRLEHAALEHAQDMAEHAYFGHDSPQGSTLTARIEAAGYAWLVAAENIALDADAPHAHVALLNSPDHRANILDPRLRQIGVAALTVGVGATLYVEDFGTQPRAGARP